MPNLRGQKVLLVEDEPLVALLLEDIIEGFGGSVAASASSLTRALELARTDEFDLAILDINLRGEMSYPAAELLSRMGVAVILVTGYARDTVPATLRFAPVLQKPYSAQDIGRAIDSVLDLSPRHTVTSYQAGDLAG